MQNLQRCCSPPKSSDTRVVPRRQRPALRRQKMHEGIVLRRHRAVHRLDHRFILLRTGDGENAGWALADFIGIAAHAAGHDHLAAVLVPGPPIALRDSAAPNSETRRY